VTEHASPVVTRVLLVRHGESVANAGGRTTDHVFNPLTELGHTQAKKLADHLDCRPTLFVVSPFQRAQQTAEPLRERFPDVPVEEWPIHEFTFLEPSRYSNSTEEERHPHVKAYWERQDPGFADGPGAESFTQFLDRARDAISRLAKASPGGCVVLFTHGFFMQAFRLALLFPKATDAELRLNFLRFHLVNFIQNTDSLEFEVRDGKIRIVGQPNLAGFTLQGETPNA
jgi:probable phosphoglycerate mutase